MKAVVIDRPGGPEVLSVAERPDPTPSAEQIVIRVRASAMNRADLLQRMGQYPAPPDVPADIPGLELAGEVAAVGERARRFAVGARVFGLVAGGAHAELVAVHEDAVAPIPASMTYENAAAIPEAFITAYDAAVLQAGLASGDTFLVHAAASGVGTAAIQIAKALGARVLGTTRTKEKLESLAVYGLDAGHVVDKDAKFAAWVREQSQGAGADVILDLVGGPYATENVHAAAPRATIVCVGLVAGFKAEIDLAKLLQKRLTLRGTVLRSRPLEEKIAAARVLERNLIPLFERGALKPVVYAVLPLFEPKKAHEMLAQSDAIGKIVLTVGA